MKSPSIVDFLGRVPVFLLIHTILASSKTESPNASPVLDEGSVCSEGSLLQFVWLEHSR